MLMQVVHLSHLTFQVVFSNEFSWQIEVTNEMTVDQIQT